MEIEKYKNIKKCTYDTGVEKKKFSICINAVVSIVFVDVFDDDVVVAVFSTVSSQEDALSKKLYNKRDDNEKQLSWINFSCTSASFPFFLFFFFFVKYCYPSFFSQMQGESFFFFLYVFFYFIIFF